MKYFDLKLKREQKMCGFRSDRELGLVWGAFMVLLLIALIA